MKDALPAAPTDALAPGGLLQLIWLASTALPVGGFSYSEGLESAVDAGIVDDETSAAVWLVDQLRLVLGRSELPLVATAIGGWQQHDLARIAALNRWALCTRESSEARLQGTQMGRSMSDWLRDAAPSDPRVAALRALSPAPTWPVASALALARAEVPLRAALLAFAFGWAENIVQAAVRAVPLGQRAGQRLLGRLASEIAPLVDVAAAAGDDDRQAFTPMLAILGARHETQYSRLFRS